MTANGRLRWQDKMQVKYPHADLLEAAQYPRAEDRALAALEQLQMDAGPLSSRQWPQVSHRRQLLCWPTFGQGIYH